MTIYHVALDTEPYDTGIGLFANAVNWDYSSEVLAADSLNRLEAARVEHQKNPRSTVETRLPTLKAFVVATAFCVELYFKSVLKCENTSIKRIHPLNELFQKMTANSQKKIAALYEENSSKDLVRIQFCSDTTQPKQKATIDQILNDCSEVFSKWRYHHEGTPIEQAFHIHELTHVKNAVRRYLVELNPQWSHYLLEGDHT